MVLVEPDGHSKICQFDNPLLRQQNICPFNVSMDYSHLVQIVQTSQYLFYVDSDQVLRQWVFLDEAGQTASLNVLQNYVQAIVLILKHIDVFDDVLVAEFPQKIDFGLHRF